MMTTRVKRRIGAATAALASAALLLTGCSGSSSSDASGNVELTVSVWANADEAKMYQTDFDAFTAEHPGINVKVDYTDVGTYQDKLNTKFAAGSPPDVMFLVGQWLGEYTSRNALLDLNDYSDVVDFDAMNQSLIKSQQVDGHTYAIPTGSTAIGMVINKKVVADAGLTMPDTDTWSWSDFATFAASISKATGDATYGTSFDTSWMPLFSTFVRENGEDVYSQDGKLTVSQDLVQKWFETTYGLQQNDGALPQKNVDTTGSFSPEQSPLGTTKIASAVIPSNVFGSYNSVLGNNLELARIPGDSTGTRPGMAVTPTLLWAAAAQSKHPKEAAELIDFLSNDPKSFATRSTFLGVPINNDVAAEVAKTLSPDDKTFVDYVTTLQSENRDPYFLEPAGAGAVAQALTSIDTEVQFGRTSPADAAAAFMSQAQDALDQAK